MSKADKILYSRGTYFLVRKQKISREKYMPTRNAKEEKVSRLQGVVKWAELPEF